MRNLMRELTLTFLLLIHNAIFHINEWVCSSNFFAKLHPSRWPIVKKIQNSSFYKTGVNFFRTSCNIISRFLGFEPVFEVKPKNNTTGIFNNFINNVTNKVEVVQIRTRDFDKDYDYWNKLIYSLELMKLYTTEFIYNFLNSWHEKISKNIDSTKKENNLSSSQPKKILDSNLAALYSLSNATQATLLHFDELQNGSGAKNSFNKNRYSNKINSTIEKIRQTHITLTNEICSLKNPYNPMEASPSLS